MIFFGIVGLLFGAWRYMYASDFLMTFLPVLVCTVMGMLAGLSIFAVITEREARILLCVGLAIIVVVFVISAIARYMGA